MELHGIHVEYVKSIWNCMESMEGIVVDSIPFQLDSREIFHGIFKFHGDGMNMETYTKMAGPSAKQIPYGMDGIHMELAWIPPGFHLECGGTVKTSPCSICGCYSKSLSPHGTFL